MIKPPALKLSLIDRSLHFLQPCVAFTSQPTSGRGAAALGGSTELNTSHSIRKPDDRLQLCEACKRPQLTAILQESGRPPPHQQDFSRRYRRSLGTSCYLATWQSARASLLQRLHPPTPAFKPSPSSSASLAARCLASLQHVAMSAMLRPVPRTATVPSTSPHPCLRPQAASERAAAAPHVAQNRHHQCQQRQQQQRQRRRACHAAAAAAGASGGAALPAAQAPPQQQQQAWITGAVLRKVTAAADANEALDILNEELGAAAAAAVAIHSTSSSSPGAPVDENLDPAAAAGQQQPLRQLTEAQCRELLVACLDRGSTGLAQSIFRAMSAAAAHAAAPSAGSTSSLLSLDGGDLGGSGGPAGGLRWPPASIQTAAALVVGLARALATREAIALVNSVRARGLASTEDVNFGHVVGCPQDRCVGRGVWVGSCGAGGLKR